MQIIFQRWKKTSFARKQAFTLFFLCFTLLFASCSSMLSSPGAHEASKANETNTLSEQTTAMHLARVRQLMQSMTLEDKLGQLLIVEYFGNEYENSELQKMVSEQHVGGYLYQPINHNFDYPLNTATAVKAFAQQAQADAKIPLLIAIDQEGGKVAKLETLFGASPSAREMAATGSTVSVEQQGVQAAQWMQQVGINTDFAPVVDVQSVPQYPLLADRTFGNDATTVSTYAGAFLNGLQKNNVIGTLKHFPGLGSFTSVQDPHDALYSISHTQKQFDTLDLAPYKQLIAHNRPAMIMATDVLLPSLDSTLPAELSPQVINGLLRKELGYQGVVVTDGIYMRGITDQWTIEQASVLAISAGDDLVEGPYTSGQVANILLAFQAALKNGTLTTQRVDEAVQRVLLLKLQYGLIK